MMKKFLPLALITALFLGGCGYAKEIDDQTFLIALGIDEGKTYNIRATFVFAKPADNGEEGKSGGTDNKSSDSVTVEGPTVYSALRQLNSIKGKQINLTHTQIIIFSEDIAKKGISEFVYGFASAKEFRPNTYVCVSKCSAEKYLKKIKPTKEITLEKYFDLIMDKAASDKVNESYLYYLYFNLVDKSAGSIVPLVDINKNKLPEEEDAVSKELDDFALNQKAGKLVRKAENETEIAGAAVFCGDKMVGTIGSVYSDIARMLSNEFPSNFYSFRFPETEDYVTVRLSQEAPPKISIKQAGENPKIRIKIPLTAEYIDLGHRMTEESQFRQFEKYINSVFSKKTKTLIKKSQQEYESDIFGFNEAMRGRFRDYPSWEKYNWKEKFKTCDIKVSYDIQISGYEELNKSPSEG